MFTANNRHFALILKNTLIKLFPWLMKMNIALFFLFTCSSAYIQMVATQSCPYQQTCLLFLSPSAKLQSGCSHRFATFCQLLQNNTLQLILSADTHEKQPPWMPPWTTQRLWMRVHWEFSPGRARWWRMERFFFQMSCRFFFKIVCDDGENYEIAGWGALVPRWRFECQYRCVSQNHCKTSIFRMLTPAYPT